MSKKLKKRAAMVAGLICASAAIFAAAAYMVLPYSNNQWSALYYEADLTKVYGQSLEELKNAYAELSALDYYEISNQFLEITYPDIKAVCLYGYEYGNAETWEQNGATVYPAKCFQISDNCCTRFQITIEKGRTFSAGDMEFSRDKAIPVILGHEYIADMDIGDVLVGLYIQDTFTYEVVGILSQEANIDLGGREVCLDNYILMPSFNINKTPIDENDDLFQVRHYANKLSGKLHYESFGDFLRCYINISDINKNSLLTEGKIVF